MVAAEFWTSGAAGGPGNRVDWNTPPEILDRVRLLGPIYLDPCSNPGSMVGAELVAQEENDGTAIDWTAPAGSVVFVNPPYGRGKIAPFADKFAAEAPERSSHLIALVPARVETKWFRTFSESAPLWCAIRGRLRFYVDGAPGQSAPFPSAVIYAGPEPARFAEVFGEIGSVWSRYK